MDKRNQSVPASLGDRPKDDDFLDQECDKIFHPEKFDPTKLNPTGTGDVDEGQRYYRSASIEAGGGFSAPVLATTEDEGGHASQDYGQLRPIQKKKSKSKKSDHGEDGKEGKHRKPSKMVLQMPEIDSEEEQDPSEQKPSGEFATGLPWKAEITPVLDSTKANKDESTTPAHQEPEKKPRFENVKFSIGIDDDDAEDGGAAGAAAGAGPEEEGHRQQHIKAKKFSKVHSKDESKQFVAPPGERLQKGEDLGNLRAGDLEDIDSHRFEKAAGLGRHKLKKPSTSIIKVDHEQVGDVGKNDKLMRQLGYGYQASVDHTPHHLFIEMDELEGEEWVERARWIKYEEDLEADAGRWGKPHVASLSFHSLINLRKCLENGVLMLDLMEVDLPGVVHRVVESLSVEGIIEEEQKSEILRVLTYRHKHVQPHNKHIRFGLKRNLSQSSIRGLLENGNRSSLRIKLGEYNGSKGSFTNKDHQDDNCNSIENATNFNSKEKDVDALVGEDGKPKFVRNSSVASSMKRSDSGLENLLARNQDILNCLEEGTEGCLTLVGSVEGTKKPICTMVRLGQSIVMQNTIEVSLPMRFIFILLTPADDFNMDCHEIGRSFSTLMSNPSFHEVCYKVEEKRELLHAINNFLDDSVVLPPGDWDRKHILPINEIMELRNRRQARKNQQLYGTQEQATAPPVEEDSGGPPKRNPFERSRLPWGGLIDDIKYRYPHYLSDFKDGLNPQCFAATIFIYFASLSGAIAFGGLMGTKTGDRIGISETLIVSSLAGIIFALFSGCPLIIVGVTGPLLLYDESLFTFSVKGGMDYLSWRVWVGFWTLIIAIIVSGFQGSVLVKHFTKFTKDIFAALICLLFIYEAMNKLVKVFNSHPLMDPYRYCEVIYGFNESLFENGTFPEISEQEAADKPNPNTALLSAILMFGTFFIAYFLRIFRNSKYFGRNVRRALGDFGVPISIVIMVLLDFFVKDTYTEKLKVPEGLSVTNSTMRGWVISPLGNEEPLAVWAMFAAIVPAILLYVILFIETEICQLIIMERTKDEKGSGLHLDVVILSFINALSGLFGGPWICSATVRAVSHVSALTVMSTNLAPGESPRIACVRDQRLSAFCVCVLLGFSVLLRPVLIKIPFAVLFGVFLYMGISGMNGVQFFDRLTLFLMPVKHHPQVSYVKRVKTWRMVLFTILQGLALVVLWIVKSTPAALGFPFFVLLTIPYRRLLKFIFTEKELDALDGPQAGKDLSGEKDDLDKDFYEVAADCPAPYQPIHKSILHAVTLPVQISLGLGPKLDEDSE